MTATFCYPNHAFGLEKLKDYILYRDKIARQVQLNLFFFLTFLDMIFNQFELKYVHFATKLNNFDSYPKYTK